MTREIAGLADIAETFDGVLVDQFGVLHDGRTPIPGARRCLEILSAQCIPVVAITNSGKRATGNRDRLTRLGFDPELIGAVISSGELAHAEIAGRLGSGRLPAGARVAILSRGDDSSIIDGLDVRRVAPGPDVDLLIIAGIEPERLDRDGYADLLAPLAARHVPAICANSDQVMYVEGGVSFGAGSVAQDYAASGAPVMTLGKPAPVMFSAALRALGDVRPARVLMIGDSPEHDIAGAAAAGCVTLLVRGGPQATLHGAAAAPDYAMDRLIWDGGG